MRAGVLTWLTSLSPFPLAPQPFTPPLSGTVPAVDAALDADILGGEEVAVDGVLLGEEVVGVAVVAVVVVVVVVVVGAGEETAWGSVVPGLPLPNPIK